MPTRVVHQVDILDRTHLHHQTRVRATVPNSVPTHSDLVATRRRTGSAAERRPRGDDAQAPTHPKPKTLPAALKPNANSMTTTSPNATNHHPSRWLRRPA